MMAEAEDPQAQPDDSTEQEGATPEEVADAESEESTPEATSEVEDDPAED